MPHQPKLRIEQLTTRFGSGSDVVTAVSAVDLELQQGETLGLVGESGSGKSVTSLAVMGLVPDPPGKIEQGKIWFCAGEDAEPVDLLSLPERAMRTYRGNRIAMIFQEPMSSLNPVMRCGRQVDEALVLHRGLSRKAARVETIKWFERVQLPDPGRIHRAFPHELSGGQKQRVMIAMALACEPDVLIADEPTTALDVTVQMGIIKLLKDLQKSFGLTVLFITHDLGVIAEIANRVAVMYEGKIVEEGTVDSILHAPAHPYTRGLLACRPAVDHHLKKLPVVGDFMMRESSGEIVGTGLSVKESLEQNAWDVTDWDARKKRLRNSQPLLKVSSLVKQFAGKRPFLGKSYEPISAVEHVSLDIKKGETVGLVGESGCGKTTLGRLVVRLTDATSGNISYDGTELTRLTGRTLMPFRKKMQMIFQDPYGSLNPRMTVGAAIREPMVIHGLHETHVRRKERVHELLETVGLSPKHYSRYPHQFSGGQRQRIVIARALAVEPEFLICDESVSALDVSVQAQVLNLLVTLREQFNLTMLFISHDLSVVKFLADRILVMHRGRIVEEGESDQIYHAPANPYTQQLIHAIPGGEA